MFDQPEELTILYTEALMQLPVKIEWSLGFWRAICHVATPDLPARSVSFNLTALFEPGILLVSQY